NIPETVRAAALRVLRRTTPGWERVSEAEDGVSLSTFRMETLTGGMTNLVFKCTKPGGRNSRVLLRAYGDGNELFFSRHDELAAFKQLAAAGLGPKLLGQFVDGRVEELLNAETLLPDDLREPGCSARIAAKLAGMHAARIDGVATEPLVATLLRRYHGNALKLCGERYRGVDLLALGDAVDDLCLRLEKRGGQPPVFCHNDLQYGNIMRGRGKSGDGGGGAAAELFLIDYEYSGYNPRGYDIANHFCEWMADYHSAEPHRLDTAKFPTISQQH
ncbi:unnamed protein product, partial [Phaeothamnion confervicola]